MGSVACNFRSQHGAFLNAAFGGGAQGEIQNGITVGLLSARSPEALTDETFTVEALTEDGAQIAIRSVNGQYVSAEGGGHGELVANRAYDSPGPWETFRVEVLDSEAGTIALRVNDGAYITAEIDGSVSCNRDYDSPGPWETWTVPLEARWWITTDDGGDVPTPSPGEPGNREPAGVVRLENRRVLTDDNGPFLAFGCSFFCAPRLFRDYRDRYDANCAFLAANGFNYYRAFVLTGGWPAPDAWEYAGAFLPWALDVLPEMLEDAFTRYRLRCSLTLFDGQNQTPSDSSQDSFVSQVCDRLTPRMHTLNDVQVANEYGPCGWDYDQGIARLRRHAQTLRSRFGSKIPISISSRNTAMSDGSANEVYAECHRLFDGLLNGIVTVSVNHDSRDMTKVDGPWRHVRQGWERCVTDPNTGAALEPDASIDDEPSGPRASVAEEEDPSRIIGKATVDFISGRHSYTYHPDAGIWSDLLHPAYVDGFKGVHKLIEDHEASAVVGKVWQALRPLLPADLPVWQRTRHGLANHPFAPSFQQATRPDGSIGFSQIWPDGITPYGLVRCYCALGGTRFVCALTGLKDHFDLKWSYPMECAIYACGSGARVQTIEAGKTGTLRIPQSLDTDLLVLGRYV